MLERLRSRIPTREQITGNRWLRWLTPFLGHPRLWHWSRPGVAVGVAIGVFFGLLIPIAQIPLAAIASIALRANIPVAAAIAGFASYALISLGGYWHVMHKRRRGRGRK